MLEKIPASLGRAISGLRAGFETIVGEAEFAAIPETLTLESAAFADGAPLPARYTEDGEKISPPLNWMGVSGEAEGLVLIVEDPDAPSPHPFVHLLAWDLPPDLAELPVGVFASPGHDGLDENLGRNSFLKAEYLPPDPPTGHGVHRYVFQLYALDEALSFEAPPTRDALVKAMKGRVLAKGQLVGTYERR